MSDADENEGNDDINFEDSDEKKKGHLAKINFAKLKL